MANNVYPLIPTKDIIPLPGLTLPLFLPKGGGSEIIEYALKQSSNKSQHNKAQNIVLSFDMGQTSDKPKASDIARIGGLAEISHVVNFPNGDVKVRLNIIERVKILNFISLSPFGRVKVERIISKKSFTLDQSGKNFLVEFKGKLKILAQYDPSYEDYVQSAEEVAHPGELADLVALILPLQINNAQKLLAELNPLKRLQLAGKLLDETLSLYAFRTKITEQAKGELDKSQHQEFIREQIRQMKAELGEEFAPEDDIEEMKKKLLALKVPDAVKKEGEKQLRRLEHLHPDTSEAALARTYIEWIFELPWGKRTRDRIDLKRAQKLLDIEHYGLEKTKDRILDFLGVRKLRSQTKGPILLFLGPPGVGKTSLGKSIAKALGRKFVRVSLGGLRDEAELRGHRRTYVGALPGRIIQGLKTAGTKNPVFMLDEIDKIGTDFRGDPASVLLEVLDPEQNKEFEDHYLNLPFDLSEVMFIATANMTDTIPAALFDRMEVIDIPGYTLQEKTEIAYRHILPREMIENGLHGDTIHFSEKALATIITEYTKESGVRELGRSLAQVLRKVARLKAEGGVLPKQISPKLIEEYLGPKRYFPDKLLPRDEIGIVTGLAWTPVGGEILQVEVSITAGKGSLNLTGQLGEVMRESAMAALTYVQANALQLGIDADFYENSSVHIHVPHGSIPKDGPSAGVAIVTALVSVLGSRKVLRDVAMTGEMTLRGNVLPIGGLREKALAALRAGIKKVVIPKDNLPELVEFPDYLKKNIQFIAVETVSEALQFSLHSMNRIEQKQPKKSKLLKPKLTKKKKSASTRVSL